MKLTLTHPTGQNLRKLCIFVWRTYLQLNLCHLISFAIMHTRDIHIPAVSMGNQWNTKISALTRFQRILWQFARKLPFLKEKTTYLQNFIQSIFTCSLHHCIRDFRKCSHYSFEMGGFHNFWVFMAHYHLDQKCPARKLTTMQDGKGLLYVIFYFR